MLESNFKMLKMTYESVLVALVSEPELGRRCGFVAYGTRAEAEAAKVAESWPRAHTC